MKAEIVMIGTELLLGQIVDTNAAYIGRTLAEHGIPLYRKTTVGDNVDRLKDVLDQALERADAIVTSGGLGPTADDLTREAIAELLGRPLELHPEWMERLEKIFAAIGRTMTENNKKQAYAPRGARLLDNPNGTAPGIVVEDARGTIVCLPGPPHELQPMLEGQVVPYLRERFGLRGLLHYRVLKICCMGESAIDDKIHDLIATQRNPTVGVLASPDQVRIRIAAAAETREEADALIDLTEAKVRARLPGAIFGTDDETLEGVVDRLLGARGWTLATAETDTGGMIAQRLTAAGAQAYRGGIVAPPATGGQADPEAETKALAARALAASAADCAIALYFAPASATTHGYLVTPLGEKTWTARYPKQGWDRQTRLAAGALEQLRRQLVAYEHDSTPHG